MKDQCEFKVKPRISFASTMTTSIASGAFLGTAVTPGIGTLIGAAAGAVVGNIVYSHEKEEESKETKESEESEE